MPRPSPCRLLLLVALALHAAVAQQSQPADALAPLRAAWVKALADKNLDASIALYRDNALFLTPDGSRYAGREAIRGLYRNVFAAYTAQITMTSRSQECSGELCVDDGEYSEDLLESETAKKIHLAGSYLLVARRQNGTWKIARIVWTLAPEQTP
ncbi:MAG TPA: SgcJ/EcaC family oxidoreductase [Acidobacteriaceae bacterium]